MTLRYVAQAYQMTPEGEFKGGDQVEFRCAVDAENGGAALSLTADCVVVFQQWVDRAAGDYDAPEILAIYGAQPVVAARWQQAWWAAA